EGIKLLQNAEDIDNKQEFLVDMLQIFILLSTHNNDFSSKTVFPTEGKTLVHSENCFKSDSLWPAQQAVAAYLRTKGYKAIFYTREEELEAMTNELEKDGQMDGRFKYYADGILRINNLEVLIMEVSSAHDKATNVKFSFDHYKGMFGALSVLKNIATRYKYATFGTFKDLKIHFLHAFGKKEKKTTDLL
ncbi:MAG: hypothetical protein EXX96DRAFT_481160, partial [Benjaminiella poitrasii]